MKSTEVHKTVRERYGRIARQDKSAGCGCGAPKVGSSCCGVGNSAAMEISKKIGYTEDDMGKVPEGANLGLGCGNPVALASLKEGEVVLDLGSGAGFDCFLAADKVGKQGRVIGVDMTPDMLDKARENARAGGYQNVEFRMGEIENLPAADNSVDAIISNCVINLSADKPRVFAEAFRVLKPGGRFMVSDIVLLQELPEFVKASVDAYIGCVAGALKKSTYLSAIRKAGFSDVKVVEETSFPLDCVVSDPTAKAIAADLNISAEKMNDLARSVVSIRVQGTKPA